MLQKEFIAMIRDIVGSEEFKKTKGYRHHVNGTLYHHSVKVAFLCYKHHERFGMKIDRKEFVRGALLHDFYLYDLQDKSEKHERHWFQHPKKALQNARDQYPLTKAQEDMIKNHMFPITPAPPRTVAGWLVCFYDKVAAISDRLSEKKKISSVFFSKNIKKNLVYNIS